MTEVRKIQQKCLEILNLVDGICRKHKIKYSLCGGSVVGAYLYGECLPWDDDIDLMMTRNNYNKFLSVAPNELPDGFSIHNYQQSEVFWSTFTKIVNDNTTIVQQDGTVSGVFLDITVYDRIPDNWKMKEDFFLWKISQIVMIGPVKKRSVKSFARNIIVRTLLKDKRRYLKFFQMKVEKNAGAKQYYYAELFGAYANTKLFIPQIFENYTEIEFEGKPFMIVRDYVDYLERRYDRTDFREPKERQVAPHYRFVDLLMPYQVYLESTKEE